MVSAYEAAALQRDMRRELGGSRRTAEKCAAALVLLAVVACFGAGSVRAPAFTSEAETPVVLAAYVLTPRLDWE